MATKSYQGHVLVASPHLPDQNFFRSVVLVLQHDENGAFGLVLNRPSQKKLKEIWEMVADEPCESEQPILLGGPVTGPLMALHTKPFVSELEILPSLYFATQKDHLKEIVRDTEHPFRIFSGYSGWGEGQLDGELATGSWLTAPATMEMIFNEGDEDLWRQVAKQIGDDILFSAFKIKHVPADPSMN